MEKSMSKYAAKRAVKFAQQTAAVPPTRKTREEQTIDMICSSLEKGVAPWVTPKTQKPVPRKEKGIALFLEKSALASGEDMPKVLGQAGPRWRASVRALAEASIQLEAYTRYVHRTEGKPRTKEGEEHLVSFLTAAKAALSEAIVEGLMDRAEEEQVASELPEVRNISEAKGVLVTAFHYLRETPAKGEQCQEAFLANAITSLFRVDREIKALKGQGG